MILLLRFLITMVASVFRPRIGGLDESVVHFTVLPTDCDLNFHLNAGRFVSFMDIARVEILGRMRVFGRLIRMGWRPMVGGAIIRYRRSILPFERFDIRTRILGWDDKWFYIQHIVERKGNLCAQGVIRGLFRHGRRNVPPEELLLLLGFTKMDSPALPDFVERWRSAEVAR